jgi:hypothetical protein
MTSYTIDNFSINSVSQRTKIATNKYFRHWLDSYSNVVLELNLNLIRRSTLTEIIPHINANIDIM